MLKLKEAIEFFKKEIGAVSNSYDWYRKCAVQEGYISIGQQNIKTKKVRGTWYVEKVNFENGIKSHRLLRQKIQQNTIDYKTHNFHGLNIKIQTDWGYYTNFGDFRLAVNLTEISKGKNNGIWLCNTCNQIAKLEHKKAECHLCSDWNGCGDDCTLSLVFCDKCITELKR